MLYYILYKLSFFTLRKDKFMTVYQLSLFVDYSLLTARQHKMLSLKLSDQIWVPIHKYNKNYIIHLKPVVGLRCIYYK